MGAPVPFDDLPAASAPRVVPQDDLPGPSSSEGGLVDTLLSPGVGALQAAGSAPGFPVDLFTLVGRGANWLTGREWEPGMDPAQSGWTGADWLRASQRPFGEGGIGMPSIVGEAPRNEIERVGRKLGGLISLGGPAGAGAGVTATGVSEVGRALDKAGVTDGYGEPVGLLAGPAVHEGLKAAGRTMIPRVEPSIARAAKTLEQHGVDVAPSQIAANQPLRYARSGADQLSLFSSGKTARQQDQFVRAVSQTFGENAPRITQDVIDSARKRIGGELQTLYKSGSIDASASPTLINELAQIERQATSTLQPQQMGYVAKALDEVVGSVSSGPLPGDAFWNMIKFDAKSALNNAMRSADPTVKGYAIDIKTAMMKALEQGSPATLRSQLAKFNKQYANLSTIDDLALRSGGDISPQALLGRVVTEQGNVRGQLGELAEAAKVAMKPLADSGTAGRNAAMTTIAAPGGAMVAGVDPLTALAAWGATTGVVAPSVRGLLDSGMLARAMINKALPQAQPAGLLGPVGQAAQATARAAPGTVGLLGRQYVSPQYFHTGLLSP